MAFVEELQHLAIPLEAIQSATNNFSVDNFLGQGGFGLVYKGQLSHSEHYCCDVAVKRLDSKVGQGQREFLMEIAMLSSCKHENLVSLVGFCDEGGEKILVYKLEVNGSLDKHLSSKDLTWVQRLQICVGAAHGLNYLHTGVGAEHKIVHRDIKSSNILLDGNWESKISDFGLSKFGPSNQQFTFLVSNACGTMGYVDPVYMKTGILTKESDVYSFGVLLLEVLCGRPAFMPNYKDERRLLSQLAQLRYEEDKLHEIINPCLIEQMHPSSLSAFSAIAFHCLKENRRERPKMELVVSELENALTIQHDSARITQIGTWGGDTGTPWSFFIQNNHKLKKITIGHGNIGVLFLIFTTEDPYGQFHTSPKFGGQGESVCNVEISEINLDSDEKIIGVNGAESGRVSSLCFLTSICFLTNKNTYGPFGTKGWRPFLVPFNQLGELVGWYGGCSWVIDSIGFCFKPLDEPRITKIGTWGQNTGSPWSFLIQINHKLKKIKIGHNNVWVRFLIFTTEDPYGRLHTERFGGEYKLPCEISEINLDSDEKIIGVNGDEWESTGAYSICFVTNKNTYGPFGKKGAGRSFLVPFGVNGDFVGWYGRCSSVIESIGFYFKPRPWEGSRNIKTISCSGNHPCGDRSPWSFLIHSDDKLRKITINHLYWIHSLNFTTEDRHGQLHTSEMFGCQGPQRCETSEVNFDADEKLLNINGIYSVQFRTTALSFTTNKKIHGPFGKKHSHSFEKETYFDFSIPFDDGEFGGCYGTTYTFGDLGIDNIDYYLKSKDF